MKSEGLKSNTKDIHVTILCMNNKGFIIPSCDAIKTSISTYLDTQLIGAATGTAVTETDIHRRATVLGGSPLEPSLSRQWPLHFSLHNI